MVQITGRKIVQLAVTLTALVSMPALAHPGMHHLAGFASGFAHPMAGWDHLLAMLAVGLWASQQGRSMAIALPLAFPVVMVLGALAAVAGFATSFAEGGIAASVLVLGLLVAFAVKMPAWGGLPVVALFAAAHGYAHGLEVPAGSVLATYGAGFVLATFMLHLAGLFGGHLMQAKSPGNAVRALGAGMAAGGVYLLAAI